jgi:hypothetical protein
MTEILTAFATYRFGKLGPPMKMLPGTNADVSCLEFGSLRFIWDLFFGA